MSAGRSLLVGLLVGALAALPFCAIALDHNPQGEFADLATGRWTENLFRLFVAIAVMVGGPLATVLTVIGFLRRRAD